MLCHETFWCLLISSINETDGQHNLELPVMHQYNRTFIHSKKVDKPVDSSPWSEVSSPPVFLMRRCDYEYMNTRLKFYGLMSGNFVFWG